MVIKMGQAEVCALLDEMGIPYELIRHQPVYTIDDMIQLALPDLECVAKNLFLRNANGKQHFLVTMPHEKKVDLKELAQKIGSSKLSFASEERLMTHLGLRRGAVTPFGVLNNGDHQVQVILDQDLREQSRVAVHPNENTATLYLAVDDLVKVLHRAGNPVDLIKL